MAGDYSRNTFDPEKHYSGVLMQQGRVQLDADWNEQLDIQQHRTATETTDVVGPAGAPKQGGGFAIGVANHGLTISPGRLYVGGLLCELSQPATYFGQPYYPQPSAEHFDFTSRLPAPPSTSRNRPSRTLRDGTYLVYLDAWQREVTFRDDPHLHEVALGEADTTTRRQTVWQVKLLRVTTPNKATCESTFSEWNQLTAPPTGRLNVRTKPQPTLSDPCALPPTAGFRRLENQLYRIEIQQGGPRATATFKWSRDNASVETSVEPSPEASAEGVASATLTVADLGRDEVLGFAPGQWVEVIDPVAALAGPPPALLQVQALDPAKRTITLSQPVALAGPLKLRRWDQPAPQVQLPPNAADWLEVEDGLQVLFSEGTYRAGDYWTFAARTTTGEVEWPPYDVPNAPPLPQPPAGPRHQYCRLALLEVTKGTVVAHDCRPLFPALTALTAADVRFDNTHCQLPPATRTVQAALDALCDRRPGHCTLTAVPGPGWEAVFDAIGRNQDAQICFPVGTYELRQPARIASKGHLKLVGSGPGTRLLAPDLEAALVFENCQSVRLESLFAQTGHPRETTRRPTQVLHANGTLTFLGCPVVHVDQVGLQNQAGALRASACVVVRNAVETPGAVRVCGCDLQVGHQQQGILLLNVTTALVEHNTLRVAAGGVATSIRGLTADARQLAAVRRFLANKTTVNAETQKSNNVRLTFEKHSISFTSPVPQKAWELLIRSNLPASASSAPALLDYLKKLLNRLLREEKFRATAPKPFTDVLNALVAQSRPVAAQGISLGGRVARDVRVLHNTIADSLQGIHVGLSHEQANREDIDRAENVTIAGNTIALVLPALAVAQDRHGIFVGNCQSLLIENNNVRLERLPLTPYFRIDGIRVWGELGDRLLITKNYLASADGLPLNSFMVGIHVVARNEKPPTAQWVATWNVAPSKEATVRAKKYIVTLPEGTNTPE